MIKNIDSLIETNITFYLFRLVCSKSNAETLLFYPLETVLADLVGLLLANSEVLGSSLLVSVTLLNVDDSLKELAFVLVVVTLDLEVKSVIEMVVDMFVVAVVLEHATKASLTLNPYSLGWCTGLTCTTAFTESGVTSETFGGIATASTEAGNVVDAFL